MVSVVVINPLTPREFEQMTADELSACCPPVVDIEVVSIESGPSHIECLVDEEAAVPGVLKRIKEWEDRADAFIINCFGDPGVRVAREVTRVPVIGPGEASMRMATLLGQRVGVVTIVNTVIPLLRHNVNAYGLQGYIASVRVTGMGVDDTVGRESGVDVVGPLASECLVAVEKDQVDVLVLGCTGMAGLSEEVSKHLRANGHNDIPVVSPTPAALYAAYWQARLGLTPHIIRCQ